MNKIIGPLVTIALFVVIIFMITLFNMNMRDSSQTRCVATGGEVLTDKYGLYEGCIEGE